MEIGVGPESSRLNGPAGRSTAVGLPKTCSTGSPVVLKAQLNVCEKPPPKAFTPTVIWPSPAIPASVRTKKPEPFVALTRLVPKLKLTESAVTVTTPQEVALYDVRKGMAMFQKVNVPLLGIIENMSSFVCSHCGERTDIFSHGGGERAASKLGVPFLGSIPIDPAIREGGDSGHPIVVANPASPQAAAFRDIAKKLVERLGGAASGSASIESLLKKIKQPFTNQ